MQKKIRTAQRQKVPFMLLAGDDDVSKGAVSFRYRSGEQRNGVPVAEAIEEIVSAVDRRVQVEHRVHQVPAGDDQAFLVGQLRRAVERAALVLTRA